tara:strand:- start:154 stop:579 length:426 start_codon:yes stop_codon:yes gene_type:complete
LKNFLLFINAVISLIITLYIFYSIIDQLPYTNFFGEIDHKIEPTILNTFISQIFNKPELLEYTFVQGNIISKFFGWSLYFISLLFLTNLSALINKDFKNEARDFLITSKTSKIKILYFFSLILLFSIVSLALEFLRFSFWS